VPVKRALSGDSSGFILQSCAKQPHGTCVHLVKIGRGPPLTCFAAMADTCRPADAAAVGGAQCIQRVGYGWRSGWTFSTRCGTVEG